MPDSEDILTVFRRKYFKPESPDFSSILIHIFWNNLSKTQRRHLENAQAMIDSLLYAKIPPKLKRSVNMARLEDASYEKLVTHLEGELELNGLEEDDDLPVPCLQPQKQHDRDKAFCH